MNDLPTILIVTGIINLVIVFYIISLLSQLLKAQKKNNYLLHRKMMEDNVKFTDEDYKYLNN